MNTTFSKYKYLFLDRDGVVNEERPNDYVKSNNEFIFETDAIKALQILDSLFDHIFIITNQRGVGRNKMTLEDLNSVHQFMLEELNQNNIQISDIYFCTDIESTSINRKPNIGMAFQAQQCYPEIVFSESIMVGNSKSDIEFGKKAGMYTVLVGDKYQSDDSIYNIVDSYSSNLYQFALSLSL